MSNDHLVIELGGKHIQAELVQVTPDLARLWLERNTLNRTLRNHHVAKLARAMERGEFHFVADPIRMTASGQLLDGQHRLNAILRSGKTIPMLIVAGLETDTQQYMDAGKPRTVVDQARLQLGSAGSTVHTSVARLLIRWDAEDITSDILRPGSPEIIAFIEDNLNDIEAAVKIAHRVYSTLRGSKAVTGAAYFEAARISILQAAEFWGKLANGEGLHRGDPVFALRDAILRRREKQRWNQAEELAAYVRAWNTFRKGGQLMKLQLTRGELTESNFRLR